MKKSNLNITFYNPNTNDETIKYLSKLLAEVAVSKVVKLQQVNLEHKEQAV